jgi:hypothetical protein
MALMLLFHKPRAQLLRWTDKEEVIMDWTLLISGTLTALFGVLSMYLMWREQKNND